MPTYEYRCRSCGEHLEVVQSFKDEPLTECPHCEGVLRKVFSPIGIAFKGSGFYRNDSRPSDGKSSDNKSDAKSTGTESKSETKAESKSESKSSESSSSTKSETKAASA